HREYADRDQADSAPRARLETCEQTESDHVRRVGNGVAGGEAEHRGQLLHQYHRREEDDAHLRGDGTGNNAYVETARHDVARGRETHKRDQRRGIRGERPVEKMKRPKSRVGPHVQRNQLRADTLDRADGRDLEESAKLHGGKNDRLSHLAVAAIVVRSVYGRGQHPLRDQQSRQRKTGKDNLERFSRDSPDESQTSINVRVLPTLVQDRREVLTATSTSGNPNAWSRV